MIRKHWCGHYNLFLTAALLLIGIRVCIGVTQQQLQTGFNTTTLTLWLTASAAVLIWQLVGGLRACDNHVREGGGVVASWLGYGSLLITLMLTIVQFLDAITEKIALQPAPPPEQVELQLLNDNSIILVDKPLNWELFSAFKKILHQPNTIGTVLLDSTGGLVFTARAMALLIQQYELDTRVRHECYSACTIVFLAGKQRTMQPAAELGFHQYSLQENYQLQNLDINLELNKDRNFFIERGVSTAFVEAIFQATPDSLWIPDRKTLTDAGVVTK